MSGAGVTHTGGLSAEGSDSSRATGYDDGSGRMARVRAGPPSSRRPHSRTLGAEQQQQTSAELGPRSTRSIAFHRVAGRDGHRRAADLQDQAGRLVWAGPDYDPSAAPQLKKVLKVFENFSAVIRVHVGGRVIRTTPEHRFFTQQRGWGRRGVAARRPVPAIEWDRGCRSRRSEDLGQETEASIRALPTSTPTS